MSKKVSLGWKATWPIGWCEQWTLDRAAWNQALAGALLLYSHSTSLYPGVWVQAFFFAMG